MSTKTHPSSFIILIEVWKTNLQVCGVTATDRLLGCLYASTPHGRRGWRTVTEELLSDDIHSLCVSQSFIVVAPGPRNCDLVCEAVTHKVSERPCVCVPLYDTRSTKSIPF